MIVRILSFLIFITVLSSCQKTESPKEEGKVKTPVQNVLTEKEKADGWKLLFDGQTTNGWRGFNQDTINSGWIVEDGTLKSLGRGGDIGGDIITTDQYENFVLKLEWKISKEGNSGIFYSVVEGDEFTAPYQTGPEYQLIDDVDFPQELEEWQKTGADYAMHNADSNKVLKPVGEWNTTKIIVDSAHVEHWLNGAKIVEFERWTDDWYDKAQNGKWKDYPKYGLAKKGYIGLQDHGSFIWFRNIKIREL